MSESRDQRVFPRRPVNPVPVQLEQADGRILPGLVLDYSPSGLSVQVESPVPLGTILRVRLVRETTRSPEFPVAVEHCHPHDGHHRLGCKFTAMQHWDDLQIFG